MYSASYVHVYVHVYCFRHIHVTSTSCPPFQRMKEALGKMEDPRGIANFQNALIDAFELFLSVSVTLLICFYRFNRTLQL